jgi:hypothetical protein
MAENETPFLSGLGDVLDRSGRGFRNIIERVTSPESEWGNWNKAIRLRKDAMQYIKDQGFLTDEAYEALSEAAAHYESPFQDREARDIWGEGHNKGARFNSPLNAIFSANMSADLDRAERGWGWDAEVKYMASKLLHEYGHYLDWNPSGVGPSGHRPTLFGKPRNVPGEYVSSQNISDVKETGGLIPGSPSVQAGDEPATDYGNVDWIPETEFDVAKEKAIAAGFSQGTDAYAFTNPREYLAEMFKYAAEDSVKGVIRPELRTVLDEQPWMRELFNRVLPNLSTVYEAREGEGTFSDLFEPPRFITDTLGPDPSEIDETDLDEVPRTHHIVGKNETLFEIAQKYGRTIHDFEAYNKVEDIDLIHEGALLRIPPAHGMYDRSHLQGRYGVIQKPPPPSDKMIPSFGAGGWS